MKKLNYLIFASLILLAACGQQTNTTNKPISHLEQQYKQGLSGKYQKIKQEVEKYYTGEKLKKILAEQRKNIQYLQHLTGEALNKALIVNYVLPKLQKNPENPKNCQQKSLALYADCLASQKVNIEKLANQIPDKQLKNTFLKTYYQHQYLKNTSLLKKASTNPIQLEAKKIAVKNLFYNGVLSRPKYCNLFPEKEVKDYCLNLFK